MSDRVLKAGTVVRTIEGVDLALLRDFRGIQDLPGALDAQSRVRQPCLFFADEDGLPYPDRDPRGGQALEAMGTSHRSSMGALFQAWAETRA